MSKKQKEKAKKRGSKEEKSTQKAIEKLHRTANDISNIISQQLQKTGDSCPPGKMRLHLVRNTGFFFGGMNQFEADSYIGMPQGSEGHILLVGTSGSGKSNTSKITLLTWNGAICATDIKGELSEFYETWSKELLRFGTILRPSIVFDPTQENGPAYDPFWWLLHDHEANLASNIDEIALAIIPSRPDEKEPFWSDTERALLSAALLYYFKLGLSFSEAISKILEMDIASLCQKLTRSNDSDIKLRLGQIANEDSADSRILVGVDRGLRNKIMLFATDPYISHAFRGERESAVCFNWDDLNRCNIFLRIPAHRVETWGRAVNLMYTQLVRYLERRPEKYSPEGSGNVQTLLLMDEFARFGKLEMITSAMSTLRSKNVNICLVVQSLAQLDKVYGKDKRRILVDNTQYLAILQANDVETQKWFAERIGTRVCYRPSVSRQLDMSMKDTGYTAQLSEAREWNIFPHELSILEDVLLLSHYGVYRMKKFRPSKEAWQWLLSSICRTHRALQRHVCASIDDPIDWDLFGGIVKTNKKAHMITIDERIAAANSRINELQSQTLSAVESELAAQIENDGCFSSAIGNLLLQQFPELLDLEPGFKCGDADWFKPLKKILSELTDNQRMLEDMKRKAYWPTSDEVNV